MFVSNDTYEGPVVAPPAPPSALGFVPASRGIGLDLLAISRLASTPEAAGHARGAAHRYLEAAYDGGSSCS